MSLKNLVRIFLICIGLPVYSQIQFEKGYLIGNDGRRLECQIRNNDWDNNPTSFKYKLSDEKVMDASIEDVSEFGFEDGAIYSRATVKIDKSSINMNILSNDRNPDWSERLVFLKKLVSGPANLYFYKDGYIRQYLYQKSDSSIVTLVSKKYTNEEGAVLTNFGYRQQLLNDVNCGSISRESLSRIGYKDTDLIRFFQQYNSCVNPNIKAVSAEKEREKFNIKLTPGVDYTMLKTDGLAQVNSEKGSGNSVSFRIGAELELIAAFNKGKWAIVLEPAFQYYKFPLKVTTLAVDVNYWSVDLPMGIRYSTFLKSNTKLFFNGMYVPSLKNKSFKSEKDMEVRMGSGAAFGVGVAKGRLSGEVRYYIGRNIKNSYIFIDPSFSKATFILGYKIFSK